MSTPRMRSDSANQWPVFVDITVKVSFPVRNEEELQRVCDDTLIKEAEQAVVDLIQSKAGTRYQVEHV